MVVKQLRGKLIFRRFGSVLAAMPTCCLEMSVAAHDLAKLGTSCQYMPNLCGLPDLEEGAQLAAFGSFEGKHDFGGGAISITIATTRKVIVTLVTRSIVTVVVKIAIFNPTVPGCNEAPAHLFLTCSRRSLACFYVVILRGCGRFSANRFLPVA